MNLIYELLPPIEQKLVILALGLSGAIWVLWLLRTYRMREEHALLWFLGIALGVALVWSDPVLAGVTRVLGIAMPASALVLLAIFFLFVTSIWLTSIVSTQKSDISELTIELSLLKARMNGTTKTFSADSAASRES